MKPSVTSAVPAVTASDAMAARSFPEWKNCLSAYECHELMSDIYSGTIVPDAGNVPFFKFGDAVATLSPDDYNTLIVENDGTKFLISTDDLRDIARFIDEYQRAV